MQKIFVVEDDDNIREMVIYALESASFYVEGFESADDFLEVLDKEVPDLLLLDIMLPGSDGFSVLKKLRQSKKYESLPVVMLTAKGSEIDRIKGLDAGADDYITKPFSVMEVISRVKAVLRRCAVNDIETGDFTVGDISLNDAKRIVRVGQDEVTLTYKEFELLRYLMLNEGIVLSRDKLLDEVWGFDYNGESRTVDMHVKSLRQKLGSVGNEIKTIRNVGYKLEGSL